MSKFDKIFEIRNEADSSLVDETTTNAKKEFAKVNPAPAQLTELKNNKSKHQSKTEGNKSNKTTITETENQIERGTTINPEEIFQKQRGRPATGKRTNPEFVGLTTYVRKETHLGVKIALLQEGKGRELSELVEELLSGWVKNK